MILNELLQVGKIDFVARAPDGKEVEELTKKDLLKALQGKVPYINNKPATAASLNNFGKQKQQSDRSERSDRGERQQPQKDQRGQKGKGPKPKAKPAPKPKGKFDRSKRPAPPDRSGHGPDRGERPPRYQRRPQASPTPVALDSPEAVPDVIKETGKSVLGTTKAIFYDEGLNSVKEVPTSLIVDELQKEGGTVRHILFDGIISQRLLDISAQEGVQTITGTRVGNVNKPGSVKVFCIDQL
jgi:DNA primase